jgi:DNA mismatch repair ATPase MutS
MGLYNFRSEERLMVHSALDFDLPRAVGAVVIEASLMEKWTRVVWVRLMDSPYAEIAVSGHPEKAVIDDCLALIKVHQHLDAEERTRGLSNFQSIDSLRTRRNRVVHSVLAWPQADEAGEQEPYLVALYDNRRRPQQEEQFTLGELKELPKRFSDAASELLNWANDNFTSPQSQVLPD